MAKPTLQELAEVQPEDQVRSPEAIAYALNRAGLDTADVAEILGVSVEVATWLRNGGHEYVMSSGVSALTPIECFPTKVARAVGNWRALVRWCEQSTPAARSAQRGDVPETGDVDSTLAVTIEQGIRGFSRTFRSSTIPGPAQRMQYLDTFGVTPATLARVCGASASQVATWLAAPASELPWNNDSRFETFLSALAYLATGPVLFIGERDHRPRSYTPAPSRVF